MSRTGDSLVLLCCGLAETNFLVLVNPNCHEHVIDIDQQNQGLILSV